MRLPGKVWETNVHTELNKENLLLRAEDFSPVFWELLRQANGNPDQLEQILWGVSREIVEVYYHEFNRAVANLRSSELPDHFGMCSEDMKIETLDYIVGQGKEFYSEMLLHPERVPIGEYINAPAFCGAALVVYRERFGQEIPCR